MTKRSLSILTFLVVSTGCRPDVADDEVAPTAQARFDPSAEPSPVIPTPTDLIYDEAEGRLDFELEDDAAPAQRDLVTYFNSLDGWPASMPAEASFEGELDPASVTAETVRVLDITDPASPEWVEDVHRELMPVEDGVQELLVHPGRLPSWPVGRRFAVAVLGGEAGVRGTDGRQVVPSPTFWFFSAPDPVAACEDQEALEGCESLTDLVEDADAAELEEIRRDAEEVFDALEAMGVERRELALGWSFRTSSRTVVPFDPTLDDVHFPNDYYMSEDETHVELHPTEGTTDAARALLARLEELDGFSLTAPCRMRFVGPLMGGRANLTSTALLFVNADEEEDYPLVERTWDEESSQVTVAPQKGLHDHTRYAVVALDYLTDVDGEEIISSHVWSIIKSHHPVVDDEGRSLIDSVDDETAHDLEEARQEYEELFEELEGSSYPREMIQAGVVFTTRSVVGGMQELQRLPSERDIPTQAESPLGVRDPAAVVPSPYSTANLSGVVEGTLPVLDATDAATREIDTAGAAAASVPFVLTLPLSPPEGRAAPPVVIFAHDLSGSRHDVFAVADDLAAEGLACLSVDLPGHGGRGVCLEDADCAGGSCAAGECNGGTLLTDARGLPANATRVMVPVDAPFAAGDALRQHALDLVSLARSVRADDGPGSLEGVSIDTGDVLFFGAGFGAMAGAVFLAVDPTVQVAVLTGAGGNLGRIVSASSAFEGRMDEWLEDDLGLEPGSAAHELLGYAWSWAADAGDPGVFAHHLLTDPLPHPDGGEMEERSLLVQVPMMDTRIPEPAMRFFWLSMGRELYPVLLSESTIDDVLDPANATGTAAREQAAAYLASGGEVLLAVGD
jgi:pimeloyl-ACP methyl ester carboxylesterase